MEFGLLNSHPAWAAWRRWFAWYPVEIAPGDYRWLEVVERIDLGMQFGYAYRSVSK